MCVTNEPQQKSRVNVINQKIFYLNHQSQEPPNSRSNLISNLLELLDRNQSLAYRVT